MTAMSGRAHLPDLMLYWTQSTDWIARTFFWLLKRLTFLHRVRHLVGSGEIWKFGFLELMLNERVFEPKQVSLRILKS